jgi:hypothetical protein
MIERILFPAAKGYGRDFLKQSGRSPTQILDPVLHVRILLGLLHPGLDITAKNALQS